MSYMPKYPSRQNRVIQIKNGIPVFTRPRNLRFDNRISEMNFMIAGTTDREIRGRKGITKFLGYG